MTNKLYHATCEAIIAKIEQGAGEFQMPWHGAGFGQPRNAFTKKPYRGFNILSLLAAMRGREFATFKQALDAGHPVRKGERSCATIFKYSTFERETHSGDSETVPFIKSYAVFAIDQLQDYPVGGEPLVDKTHSIAAADKALSALGVPIVDGGVSAFYRPASDQIGMPRRELFKGTQTSSATEAYYSTLAHESVHATGHASRLARTFGKRFGDETYALEELVAELGAAFFCAAVGINNSPRDDHAQYLASWLRVLKKDGRALWAASSKASAAVDFILEREAEPLAIAA